MSQGIHFVLQLSDLSHVLTHCVRIPLLRHGQFVHFSPVELCHFLQSNDSVILQFLGNVLCDFDGRAYSSFPILHTNLFFLCERCLPTNSLDEAVTSEIQVLDRIHKGRLLNFFAPIL